MKRAAVISSIIAAVAAIVFAFIIGGGDGVTTEAKSPTTENPAKQGAEAINNNSGKGSSGEQSQGGGPTTSEKKNDDNKGEGNGGDESENQGKNCKAESKGKYETKKAFLGLDPSTVRLGRKVEFEVKNFRPCAIVTVSTKVGDTTVVLATVTVDKKGKGEGKFTPTSAGKFVIVASDGAFQGESKLTVK